MDPREHDDNFEDLINIIDSISTNKLKQKGYHKYVDRIVKISSKSLDIDATRLLIIIQYIKNYGHPCFQRDILIEVLYQLVNSQDIMRILIKPYPVAKSYSWDALASGITAIPDLVANCNCLDKYPTLCQETFYKLLAVRLYDAIVHLSQLQNTKQSETRFFLLKIIGRIAISKHKSLIWEHLTWKAMQDSRTSVKDYYFDLIRLTLSPRKEHVPFGIYMESICSPIFTNLKPSLASGEIIKSLLGDGAMTNDQLRYIICDKYLFKTNYNLTKEKQAIILSNIAAYLSSLVTTSHIDKDKYDTEKTNENPSLLIMTLLEIVRSWTSGTKILIRSYHHSKYITFALLIFLKHALQYDKESLSEHASEIQTMIARSIPTYLNRASREERNLATCLGQLALPKLHRLAIGKRQIAKDGESEELRLDFNVDFNDDLLYLQQLFQQDVEVLFRDLADTAISPPLPIEDDAKPASSKIGENFVAIHSATTTTNNKLTSVRKNDKQLQEEARKPTGDGDTCRLSINNKVIVEELDNQHGASKVRIEDDDDDLKPYMIDEPPHGDSGDDEFELGEDAADVPIYLRDCINGLIENNNRLYVRLCLIKAGVLVDDLIEQDEADAQKIKTLGALATNQARLDSGTSTSRRPDESLAMASNKCCVNDTLSDVGIELARSLLFLDDQFSIEEFNEHRMSCLISLCYAVPSLVGKYLIDELNGQSRSFQQQLDILHILVSSAHWLSTGSKPKVQTKLKEASLNVKDTANKKIINRFAPFSSMYFYGIVYRLKADFSDAAALVISQPKSIMSAFRQQNRNMSSSADIATIHNRADIMIKKAISQDVQKHTRTTVREASSPPKAQLEEEKFLEANSLSDDSFLLSSILVAIANIISCSAHQVVTCKIATDLLDILSAYRCHPDTGVQKAIINCLKMIRDCTPSTYFGEYIERRMLHLFGPWLSKIETNT